MEDMEMQNQHLLVKEVQVDQEVHQDMIDLRLVKEQEILLLQVHHKVIQQVVGLMEQLEVVVEQVEQVVMELVMDYQIVVHTEVHK